MRLVDSLKLAITNAVWFSIALTVCLKYPPEDTVTIASAICLSMWWICLPLAILTLLLSIRDFRRSQAQTLLAVTLSLLTVFGGFFPGS